jgi:hypothetical protein
LKALARDAAEERGMRKALIAGLTVALAAPWSVRAQEGPPPPESGVAPVAAEPGPGPQPGDVAPAPPLTAEPKKKKKKFKVMETAGGAVGGALAKTAATAVAGPVGGIAAGIVGARVGRGAVTVAKKVVGVDDRDGAKAASDTGVDVSAWTPDPTGRSEVTPPPEPEPLETAPPEPVGSDEPTPVADAGPDPVPDDAGPPPELVPPNR